VRTFQHVLEGYRVADEMAAHHAGGSTFADWWAYKIEAYEAIPYNAALMTRRGVLSSVNSDSGELARHLNFEAAKSMRYGGLTPEESLALVTINPARQLGIDKWVGSLEPGKDGDFVVWAATRCPSTRAPSPPGSRGRSTSTRPRHREAQGRRGRARAALIQKVKDEREEKRGKEERREEKKGERGREGRESR
jgi:imidazolonepropionase-like amidohydrolase